MAIDIHGKWQKRDKNSENWQEVKGNFEWFNSWRCRGLFYFLYEHRNYATDDIEKELIVELSKEFNDRSILQKKHQRFGYGRMELLGSWISNIR